MWPSQRIRGSSCSSLSNCGPKEDRTIVASPETVPEDPRADSRCRRSSENRTALRAILSSPDYRIVEAGSGAEALLRLLEEDFAVLLIDVVMPDMSGFELAAAIKERERTAAIPIVFLTAQATDVDLVSALPRWGGRLPDQAACAGDVRAKVAVFAQLFREKRETSSRPRSFSRRNGTKTNSA